MRWPLENEESDEAGKTEYEIGRGREYERGERRLEKDLCEEKLKRFLSALMFSWKKAESGEYETGAGE